MHPAGLILPKKAASGFDLVTPLTAWWELDETTGTRVDAHSTNDLTMTGTVGYVTGVDGNAASFSGGNAYLSATFDLGFSSGKFSCNLWFKTTTNQSSKGLFVNRPGTTYQWIMYLGTDATHVYCRTTSGVKIALGSGNTEYYDGNWHMMTGVWDNTLSTQSLKLYWDGVMYSSIDTANEAATYTGSQANNMGRWNTNSSTNCAADIDMCGIWGGYALSSAEIDYLWNNGSGRNYSNL